MNETDTYRELPPPPGLRSSIACVWRRRGDGGSVRIVPDACVDIVWRRRQGAVVAGPDTGPWLSRLESGEVIFGVRFLPGAGGAALGIALEELRDRRIGLVDLHLDPREQLGGDADLCEVPMRLIATASQLVTRGPPDRTVQAAVVRLMDPRQRVDELARQLGLSERQLRRRFQISVGYGPKTLQRVLRLRRFAAGAHDNLAMSAMNAGYSDQAHLTRECLRLTGLSPTQWLSHRSP
ncbi:MAG: helix-turn-helix domain-containing protein [Solirubrobacteraceae bacterium]